VAQPKNTFRQVGLDDPNQKKADPQREARVASTTERQNICGRFPVPITRELASGETILATCGCTYSKAEALCGRRYRPPLYGGRTTALRPT
jgi:hypothetical protein